MKCPNCGAEAKGEFCEYCGSEMSKEKTAINITNNYYVNAEDKPHKKDSKSAKATTMNKKKRTWLWVLGWICIFPLPLTILLLRKKNMKPAVKYGIIAVAWLLFFAIGSSGNRETGTTQNNTPAPTEVVQVEQATTATTEAIPETTEVIPETAESNSPWAKQEANIRRFVREYNEISDNPITGIEFRNNHTIAYYIADGFSITNIKVSDHDDMGFFFTFEFSDGTASLEKYENFMRDAVMVFDPNVDIGEKFKEANANLDTVIHLSDSISIKYHYIKDAIGYQAGDTYIITLISADYNKQ